ncbi:MAG: Gfo/Idh/MocA family oxidoreductase, partial [Chloroflexi bacterium]|nr:Gfo/Idh/MocA family oxidoreductase [Chloroflexota bacterium]
MRTVGVGIVGLGYVGRTMARIFKSMKGVKLVGVVTKTPERGKEFASRLDTSFYPDLNSLLDRDDLHGVVVATPNDSHRDPVVSACLSGRHVFVEKPMALKVQDCTEMIDAARKAKVNLMVGHMMRLYDGVEQARQFVHSGDFGAPMTAHCERTGWEQEQGRISWKKMQQHSGGHLFHHIHEIDLFLWYFGEVDTVFCFSGNLGHRGPHFGDEDDVLMVTLRFKNGALGTMHYGSGFRISDHFVRFTGSRGGVVVSHRKASVLMKIEDGSEQRSPLFSDPDSQRSMMELFSKKDLGVAYGLPDDEPPHYLTEAFKLEAKY